MNKIELLTPQHTKTKRDYLGRMNNDKVECMKIAQEFEFDYWDGDRKYGYGGYKYDGRWKELAKNIVQRYKLDATSKILDVGCGMGHLLYEIKQYIGCEVLGLDISEYAKKNSMLKNNFSIYDLRKDALPYDENDFDLVLSIMTLHNLKARELHRAIGDIERVGKNKYIAVESFRNNSELFNLQCWALTCMTFFDVDSWMWMLEQANYTGDYELLFFE